MGNGNVTCLSIVKVRTRESLCSEQGNDHGEVQNSSSVDLSLMQTPRGGTLKFSVYIGEADFFGVKILNFRIFLGFQKN